MVSGFDSASLGDYVLGLTTIRQRKRIGRRIETDARVRALVDELQACLAPLNALSTPVTPPEDVWRGILARLNNERQTLPSQTRTWGWAIAGCAFAALALFILTTSPARMTGRAELRDTAQSREVALIETDSRDDVIVTNEGMPMPPAGKSLELWVIPTGGIPKSLGVLSPVRVFKLHAHSLPDHATFAISVEPQGGAPGGSATGPVIVSGELHRL